MLLFALFGLAGTSWMSRLPSIREALGVSSGGLGLIIIVGGVGALLSVLSTGAVVSRFGSRNTLVAATAINVISLLGIAAGTGLANVQLFAISAFVHGVSGALMNVPINLNGAIVEQKLGKTILPHFHAGFSIGAAIGALIGAGFSLIDFSIVWQIVIIAVVVAAARVVLIAPATVFAPAHAEAAQRVISAVVPDASDDSAVLPTPSVPTPSVPTPSVPAQSRRRAALRAALAAWKEPRTILIGLILLASSLSEGAAGTWLTIAVVDGFAVQEALGAASYAIFVTAMTVFRFLGTGLIDRFGRVAVLRVSALATIAGLLIFAFAPGLIFAWIGVALWGCGAALANPIAISAASDDPQRAAARVSVVTSFISFSSLTAPPLLGLLIDEVGGRHALLVICVAALLSLSLAAQVRRLPVEDKAPGPESATDAGPGQLSERV